MRAKTRQESVARTRAVVYIGGLVGRVNGGVRAFVEPRVGTQRRVPLTALGEFVLT